MTSRAPNPSTGSRKISFNVSEQYDIQDVVGEGAYGVVWYVQLPRYYCPFTFALNQNETRSRLPRGGKFAASW